MARIRLIRHGEAASAWGGGDPDPGLSPAGRIQAQVARDRLMLDPPTHVVTSPLRRCRETAAPSVERLGVAPVVAEAVAEVPTPASLPAKGRPDWLRAAFAGTWAEVAGGDYLRWRDGVAAFLLGLEDGTAIFTHFVAINAAVSAAMDDPRVAMFHPGAASITTLEIADGRLRVVELGAEAETRVL